MNVISVWSFLAIFYQTILCIIISWLTLSCKLTPDSSDLHELTLMKMLYLYEPETCGRFYFYNYTMPDFAGGVNSALVWLLKNDVAAQFRSKLQVWLGLHVIWTVLGLANLGNVNRSCGFYVTLIPFTLTGLALLLVDVIFCALFLIDATETYSENAIISYISKNSDNSVYSINSTIYRTDVEDDTSWIAVLLAYCSIRGVVQWIINFWIIKDSYFKGIAAYNYLPSSSRKVKRRIKSSEINNII